MPGGGGPERIVIELAGEPRGKGRPRFVRATGMAYTPSGTRAYESALRLAAQESFGRRPPLDAPVRVLVLAVLPIPRSWPHSRRLAAAQGRIHPACKPDIDNLLKVLDALNQVVWCDDKQIVEAHVVKAYGPRPSLRIEVEPIPLTEAEPARLIA